MSLTALKRLLLRRWTWLARQLWPATGTDHRRGRRGRLQARLGRLQARMLRLRLRASRLERLRAHQEHLCRVLEQGVRDTLSAASCADAWSHALALDRKRQRLALLLDRIDRVDAAYDRLRARFAHCRRLLLSRP